MRGISSVSKALFARATKLARALFCGAALVSIAGYGSLRVARAEVRERLRGFGAELASWQSARPHSASRRLSVNGLELGLLTLSTSESVSEVLDRFHARCRERAGFAVPEALKSELTSPLDGTFREESEEEGLIACLDTERPLAFEELSERLRAFGKSGDLAAIGELRYAFARREGSRTTIVALWTEGAAKLFELFPKSGDAPGRDPRDVPRPPGSRRLLSGIEHGMPYSLTIYQAETQSKEELRRWYAEVLAEAGWNAFARRTDGPLMVQKGERTLSIDVGHAKNGQTVVSVAELS
jgi:hypothetical protein